MISKLLLNVRVLGPRLTALKFQNVYQFQPNITRQIIIKRFTSDSSSPQPAKAKGNSQSGFVTWRSVRIVSVISLALLLYMWDVKAKKLKAIEANRKREIGKAGIGGPFELVDHTGKTVKSEDLLGKWLLIYFGFTHCPDICPDEIEKMVKAVEILNKDEGCPGIQPVFISVDPERDSPEIVGKYIHEFSPDFIALTGNKEQVANVCKAYRVYYSAGPADEDNDYIVDHTIIIYLIDHEGNFVDYYGQSKGPGEVADGILYQMYKRGCVSYTSGIKKTIKSVKKALSNA